MSDDGAELTEGISRETAEVLIEEWRMAAEDEYGFRYRCPRCGYDYVTEYCDCPECLWAGMCQVGWA